MRSLRADVISGRLRFDSSHPTEFIDLTDRLREHVRRAGLVTGRVHLQSLHTTLGLAINENEPLLLRDMEALLARLAPAGVGYEHDDLARRQDIPSDEPTNGHAHCRSLFLQPALTALVVDGRLLM